MRTLALTLALSLFAAGGICLPGVAASSAENLASRLVTRCGRVLGDGSVLWHVAYGAGMERRR